MKERILKNIAEIQVSGKSTIELYNEISSAVMREISFTAPATDKKSAYYSTGAPVVDFYVPDWEVIVKGSAFEVGWNGTDRLPSFGSRFELEYDFIEGGEFGFAVFGDGADPKYGDYVGWNYMGKDGDANQFFSQKGNGNNIVCNKGGRYKIVIDFSGDDYVLDFYLVA